MSEENDDKRNDSLNNKNEQRGRSTQYRVQKSRPGLMGSLVWVAIILSIISLAYYSSQRDDFEQESTPKPRVAKVQKKAKSESSVKDDNDAQQKESTETSKESKKEVKSSLKSSSSSSEKKKYVAVEAGQGLYRVAVNNGISVQELMNLNGLSASSDIKPGQQLRVR